MRTNSLIAVIVTLLGLAAAGAAPPPAGDDEWGVATAGRAVTEHQQALSVTLPEFRAAAKKKVELERPSIDRPAAPPDEVRQAATEYERLAAQVSRQTVALTEAKNNLAAAERKRDREQAATTTRPTVAPSVAASTAPFTQSIDKLEYSLDESYRRAIKVRDALQAMKGLLPEDGIDRPFTNPLVAVDPFDRQLKQYQDHYDGGQRPAGTAAAPSRTPTSGAAMPSVRPDPPQLPATAPGGAVWAVVAPPIDVAGTTWKGGGGGASFAFQGGGTFVEQGADGKAYSGTWRQAGGTVTASHETRYAYASYRRDYTFTVVGNRGTVSIRAGWTPAVDTPPTTETFEIRLKP
jgi:hypothetical protein